VLRPRGRGGAGPPPAPAPPDPPAAPVAAAVARGAAPVVTFHAVLARRTRALLAVEVARARGILDGAPAPVALALLPPAAFAALVDVPVVRRVDVVAHARDAALLAAQVARGALAARVDVATGDASTRHRSARARVRG